MTLPIDTSRAIRTLSQQRELVRAIVDAPAGEQETDWLEWKTDVDLAAKEWRATISRHILGLANRHPDSAAQQCDGCAYVVLGAEPGQLRGTTVYDISTLDPWLSAYVGSVPDAPHWSATYVDMHVAQVLLVTIEGPRWGDPIWTFQKEYTPPAPQAPMRAGTIYVRRRGSTEQANPTEVRMLSQRAASGPRRLSLALRLSDGDAATPIDLGDDVVETWVAAERAALIPLMPATPNQRINVTDVGRAAASFLASHAALTAATFGETRTIEAFKAEVETYLVKAKKALPGALRRGAVRQNLGRLGVLLVNETDHNFSKVAVELHFAQTGVKAYFSEFAVEGPELPSRPAGWGFNRLFDPGFMGGPATPVDLTRGCTRSSSGQDRQQWVMPYPFCAGRRPASALSQTRTRLPAR